MGWHASRSCPSTASPSPRLPVASSVSSWTRTSRLPPRRWRLSPRSSTRRSTRCATRTLPTSVPWRRTSPRPPRLSTRNSPSSRRMRGRRLLLLMLPPRPLQLPLLPTLSLPRTCSMPRSWVLPTRFLPTRKRPNVPWLASLVSCMTMPMLLLPTARTSRRRPSGSSRLSSTSLSSVLLTMCSRSSRANARRSPTTTCPSRPMLWPLPTRSRTTLRRARALAFPPLATFSRPLLLSVLCMPPRRLAWAWVATKSGLCSLVRRSRCPTRWHHQCPRERVLPDLQPGARALADGSRQVPPRQAPAFYARQGCPPGGQGRGQGWQLRVHQWSLCRSLQQAQRLLRACCSHELVRERSGQDDFQDRCA